MSTEEVSKEEFNKAVRYIQEGPKNDNLTNEVKLKFYGLYKQATHGPCYEKPPSRLKVVQRMKWTAWNNLGRMSKTEAMSRYVKELDQLVPNWREWEGTRAKL